MRANCPPAHPGLAAEIARRGLTVAALSHRVGCHAGHLGRFIAGRCPGSTELRSRIVAALEVPADELFGGVA